MSNKFMEKIWLCYKVYEYNREKKPTTYIFKTNQIEFIMKTSAMIFVDAVKLNLG